MEINGPPDSPARPEVWPAPTTPGTNLPGTTEPESPGPESPGPEPEGPESEEPVRPAHTTKAGRVMAGIGWTAILVVLATLGLAVRIVGDPPWWNASEPWIWIPVLFALYCAMRDARWLVAWSVVAAIELAVVGLLDRAAGHRSLGRYELLLALSGLALTVAAWSGRIRPARQYTEHP
jgi:hypothetical protein